MHSITWEEVLRGDSIPVYLCFPFFMTVLLAQPCTFSSLLGSLCQGVACQEGPAWPLTPTMHLGNFPLSLKKPVSAPNESHNHSCDPATGSECPGSTGQSNAWHQGDPGGKEGERVELSGHQCHLLLQAPMLLMNLLASSARGSHSLSHLCPRELCVDVQTLLCEGTSVGYKGQGETRHSGLPTIHCRCSSWRYLLLRISSAPSNIQPNHMLPQSFWRVSLSWLSHWSFFPYEFFSCSEEMK